MIRKADINRAKILEAAFAEIHVKGFQAAGINDILARTGLTKGALYHHFSTKQALGLAVMDEVIAPIMRERMIAPLDRSETPLRGLLDWLTELSQKVTADHIRLGCPINNLIQEMSAVDEAFRMHLAALIAEWRGALQYVLQRAQEAGELRAEVDVDTAALFLVSCLEGSVGVSKNMQSVTAFTQCLGQIRYYLLTLTPTEVAEHHAESAIRSAPPRLN